MEASSSIFGSSSTTDFSRCTEFAEMAAVYNCVLHHGDHEQFRITVFCPKLYFHGALQTWLDKELFEQLPISIGDAQKLIHRAFSKRLIRRYPWGFRKGALLPYGFVFLKRKKQWAKGRTLISYHKSYQAKLLKAHWTQCVAKYGHKILDN